MAICAGIVPGSRAEAKGLGQIEEENRHRLWFLVVLGGGMYKRLARRGACALKKRSESGRKSRSLLLR